MCSTIFRKFLPKETKAVLKHDTLQSSGEFLTTDAMKHIVQETKKKFKDCDFLAQRYHIACINTMCRYYAYKGNRMLSTFFPVISVYIETQVHFFGTMLNQIADSFQVEQEVIDLPKPIVQWFKANLDNFDVFERGLENIQLFVETTSPLLGSNAGHLPQGLRVILNGFVTGTLKKEVIPSSNRKRGRREQSIPGLESLKAPWIGPDNCTANTTETDTAEKPKSEWVVVDDAPFDPKVDNSGAAFVCLNIR